VARTREKVFVETSSSVPASSLGFIGDMNVMECGEAGWMV
jgi:hypothetical protein